MIIVGIGMPKTATKTFVVALRKLGIKSCHYPFNIEKKIKEGFRGFAENEAILKYKEIYEKYPDSMFVLTKRDMNSWLKSVKNHYRNKNPNPKNITKEVRKKTLGCVKFDEEKLKQRYIEHHKEVRDFFKNKDRYIEINIIEGDKWKPICEFLNIKIPNKKFPHKNKA